MDKIRFQIKLAEEAGEARMEDFELQNIEYKVIWKKEFLDEICGMANASGGKIYIGKDDDGNTVDLGFNETRRLLESISNSIV